MKPTTINAFHAAQSAGDRAICDALRSIIDAQLQDAESKIWHGHPVWFLNGNPIVGYSKLKDCVRMMFWSGADFEEPQLKPGTGKYKDASARFTEAGQIDEDDLIRWLRKSRTIQWDYKNIYKRKGRLERLPLAALTLASLVLYAADAVAQERIPFCVPLVLPTDSVVDAPPQYQNFCARTPQACDMAGSIVVDWTLERHGQLREVNAGVNADILFTSDFEQHGVEERWDLPLDCRGDCEDFALEKRERLVALGWPRASLTMAFAYHEVQFFPHAVLLAETTQGTWVLDNLYDEVRCWDGVPYRYTFREQADGNWRRFLQ